jgi:TRAP transporter TAXI family solute receptor
MMTRKNVRHHFTIRLRNYLAAVCALIFIALTPASAMAVDIFIGTGPEGTFSHFTGRTICRIISRHADDIACRVVPANDAIDNFTNLQGGSLDIGLLDSVMLTDAVNKTGYFKFLDIRYDNLRELLPLYDRPATLVVRGDAHITALETLKGKRLNAGAPRSEERLVTDMILTAKNWSKDDFSLFEELSASQSQDTMAFCHGEVEAMVNIGVHPAPSVQQLVERCDAAFVDMDDSDIAKLIDSQPALSRIDIPAGVYPSIQMPIATFGTTVFLIASGSLDEETAYKIMQALDKNQQNLKNAHTALRDFTVGPAPKRTTEIELHPGAAKYFSEK